MKKTLIATAIAGAFALPTAANAVEVVGEKLEIYGKVHLSGDFVDSDQDADENEFVISSNSSRLGFKGKYPVSDAYTVLYQVEQQVDITEADSGDVFATRNTFLGLGGSFGDVLIGRIDTPFKDMGKEFTVFGDTVADRRAILGAEADGGNEMNERGADAIMWRLPLESFEARLMYSPNGNGDFDRDGNAGDDTDTDMFSASVLWEMNALAIGAAYEDWDNLDGRGKTDGYRVGASYDFGMFKLGAIFEDIDSDTAALSRKAYGANVSFKVAKATKIKAQWLHADESDRAGGNDEADMISVGAETELAKNLTLYGVYTQTDNDANAAYQGIDGGHGEELRTDAGGDPNAFSVGAVWKF